MVQPPNYGPPEDPDPGRRHGPGPGQPPTGPWAGRPPPEGWPPPSGPGPSRPEGHGPPQYPPPGAGQPPPGGVPPYPPGGQGPVYPGGQGPGGPGQPPGGPVYGPGPPGPPRKSRTGLIAVIAVVGAVLLVVAVVLIVTNLREGEESEPGALEDTSEEATEPSPTEPETTGPPTTEEAVGLCLPAEPQIAGYSFDLSTPCDAPEAFWRITAAADDTGAAVDQEGMLADVQVAYDLCGEEHGSFQLGEPWKDWYFTYDEATSNVEELYCVEAVGNPDEEGRTPVTPDTGACFDDSDTWWTVPCDSDLAMYEVVDTITVDPPEEMSTEEANEASTPCSGGEFFWQVKNVEGLTTAILCGDER
ncbi:MAG TPA: hypothetical protein VKZ65_10865 [Glycomyces sp.]|nr:hypothetical protein [Glycomyces sp.]